jgi:1,4-dihydroxy-2-naphthoyl-CoA hydrolase
MSMIWKYPATLEVLNSMNANTLNQALGIEFSAIGDDFLEATMPVTANTVQPFRILHGGASVCLAETLGSVASNLCMEDLEKFSAVGLEINANHLKSVPEGGLVTGTCKPIRVGKTVHVWQIEMRDQAGNLTCISRLTVAIVPRKG